jgi:hypothetical protein
MLVASGPYNHPIPFVNIQEIRLNTNTEGDLVVTLGISNETSTPTREVRLGNYVMVSNKKADIVNLSRNIPRLIETIKRDAEGRTELSLAQSDFTPKITTNNPELTSQQVFNYVYETTRVVKRSDDLYALVVSYTNFQEQYTIGNIVTDKLLSKKKLPTEAKLYILSETVAGYGTEGSIWPGAGHLHKKKIMAGASHTEFTHPYMAPRPAMNVKSKDMRVIKLAKSLRFDERQKDPGSSRSYFSELTLSRNSQGAITGLFSFDHLRFAAESTRFGRLIKNDGTLLSAAGLKDIVIYQKILAVDTAGNELTPGRSSHGALNEQKMSTRVASLGDGLRVTSTLNNNTILNVSFEDLETTDLVGNLVEYSVEVLLDDNTGAALQSIVEQLSAALPRYQSPSSPPYKDIIDLYLASVQAVFGSSPFRTLTASMWQKSLIALTAPTGLHATEDQGSVLETIQEFTNKLNRTISTTQNNASAVPNYHSKIYSATRDAGCRTTHVFFDKYQVKDSAGYGLDYLESHLVKNKNILPALSYEAMNTRSKNELKKYNINNPTANSVNTVGYLSPELAKLGPKLNPVPTTTLQNSNDNFVSIIRSTKELNLVTSPEPDKDMATDKEETLALVGVSIKPNETSLRKQVFDLAIVKPTTMDSKGYLSSNSGFTTVTTPEETRVSGSTESVAKSKKLTARPTTAPVVTNLIDRIITEFQTITRLANTDSIQGSIALAKSEQDTALIEESDAMTNILNFGSLVQVQYLAEYDRRLGVKRQNWRLLTDKIVRDADATNRTLICRLVAVSNTLDAPSIVQLSTLSSLFTLGPGFIKPSFPTFRARFNTILTSFVEASNINLKDVDSVDTLYANNMPLSSKVAITADPNQDNETPRRPGRRRPRPTGGLRY